METLYVVVVLGGIGYAAYKVNQWHDEEAGKGADKILCPHCGVRGCVTGRSMVRGKGISGGKATAGLMTGGLSLPFAGLSKNQRVRTLKCSNCNSTWDVT